MPGAALSWQSSGIVSNYDLRVGDVVEKGQVLLTLEDSSISPDILRARTSLLEAQIEYQKMLSANIDYLTALQEVNTQEVILENTYSMRHEFYDDNTEDERVEGIYASYTQARVDVWALEDAYEKVKDRAADDPTRTVAYEALQAGILKRDSLQRAMSQIMGTPYGQRTEDYFILYDVRAAELAQARAQAQRLLNASDELSAGVYAGSGDFAVQLDDLSNLVIELEISQMEINKIKAGQTALVTFSALPNASYEGVVDNISLAGSTNGDDALFKVRIVLTDADEQVKPGFTAMASIITNQVESALLVPNQAIQYTEDGSAYVMKRSGLGQSTEIRVETGARSDAYSELLGGGLEEGDVLLIAAAGSESYQAGSGEALRDARRLLSGR
jgi:HlyD family secretion protein